MLMLRSEKMLQNQSLVSIVVNLVITSLNYCNCEQSLNCGSFVRSTCTDDVTTEWSKHSIGKNLKTWITSISNITPTNPQFYIPKTLYNFQDDRKKEMVKFIANTDCLKGRPYGPTWRKPSTISSTQFHDGFLYGIEDEMGELTGMPKS
jgi:hypothetical protein